MWLSFHWNNNYILLDDLCQDGLHLNNSGKVKLFNYFFVSVIISVIILVYLLRLIYETS